MPDPYRVSRDTRGVCASPKLQVQQRVQGRVRWQAGGPTSAGGSGGRVRWQAGPASAGGSGGRVRWQAGARISGRVRRPRQVASRGPRQRAGPGAASGGKPGPTSAGGSGGRVKWQAGARVSGRGSGSLPPQSVRRRTQNPDLPQGRSHEATPVRCSPRHLLHGHSRCQARRRHATALIHSIAQSYK